MQSQKRPEDLKREEQLFLYLQKSYTDHSKGLTTSMNKIQEEVCRKSKETQQICMWVDLFNRLLLQLQRSGGDVKLIIDIVLYKMPWFTSENHFQALPAFKKILFTILSTSSSQLATIYRFLVQKLGLQMQIDQEQTRDDIPCQVMGLPFSSKVQLQQHVLEISNSYELNAENQIVKLSESHKQFIKEILVHHPRADEKLQGMVDLGYGYFPAKNKSKCFYVIKKNNHYEDISYVKGIDGLYNHLYRDKYFSNKENKHVDAAIQLICEINQIYKLSKEKLLETLTELFPHKNQSELHQRVYVTNCMRLSDRLQELRPRIFKMVFVKILQIDSEIKIDPILNNFIIKTTHQILHKKHRDEMCKKVDHLLFILFDYLDSKRGVSQKSIFIVEQNEDLIFKIFRELQTVFQDIMLKNQYYRMAHFIFLYFCSLPNQLQKIHQLFLSQLVQNIRSTTLSKTEKINSLYYLSSLLVRCNSIKCSVFNKAVELLLEFLDDSQVEAELEHHLVQMMVFLISTKSTQLGMLKDRIHLTILHRGTILQHIHYDILVKFNEVLLRSKFDDVNQRLIEITAKTISQHIGTACSGDPLTNHLSPNTPHTPQKLIFDHESLFSKTSTQRTVSIRNQMDFYQPFNCMTLIYSEPFIKEYYRYDSELIKDEGGSLNGSHIEEKHIPQFCEQEKPVKKVKL